ncbi:nck-associated protein 5 isoform X1 [Alexandromys fortis]|uniref:nck-associated protein 5 isoform X1 n=3 Tax=Alexandromys fortis TaxID=100897 RepID=UPI00215357D4|nr:nck-associated protein 5 isoform X1 [Microtus fortis]XP_050017436.1 nck-associated protein 5 isoform X1 [Microtus fortis]
MEGKRQLYKRDFGKRLSLDSSLVEYMDSNKCIEHLLTQLREQHRSLWREKLAVARLQREVAQRTNQGAMHEKLIHELEEERHLRLQSEERLREVTLESERNRIQMRGLQQQFSRMEETVRSLLQSQGSPEQRREEPAKITAFQERVSEEERKHHEELADLHSAVDEDSRSESSSTDEGKENTRLLLKRLKALEAENSALALENESQREQYERCLDEVANQVVRALLTQKDLREECVKLKTRVFDLEQQNRALSILFQQRVRPASDVLLQEHLQNAKAGTPALRHSGSGVIVPDHLCPGNSCSSSELSLSSTCSEFSSDSSYKWPDRKLLGKRQSSQNWDKRLSIDSSLPSGFASPADELPPTRIKESHILEGLRKLQKRKVLLEPPSVITKWGYKDCMNSNEGIYSPGIKNSSLKEYPSCQPPGPGVPCKGPHHSFIYDADSRENVDEDSPPSALLQAAPSQGCRIQGSKLTHSVSDSLFSWEPHGKYFSEGTALVHTREMPERLVRCASHCPLERKLCPSIHLPWVQRDRDPHRDHVALNLHLSDTDDNETLNELHIESSDGRSPSDLSLTGDTDKSMENLDGGSGKSEWGSQDVEEDCLTRSETRPKTFSFIRQQRIVKRTSSEECITVVFDAENGEPVEFSSHQTGVVTVTRDEISINSASAGPSELTQLLPQGTSPLQPGATARDYPFRKRPEEETEKNIPKDENGIPTALTDSFDSQTTVTQNSPRPKPAKPTQGVAWQSNSRPGTNMGVYAKPGLTKIPSRGKSSPQKSKLADPVPATLIPSSDLVTHEETPASPPGKLPHSFCDGQPESHIPNHPTQLPHIPNISNKKNWIQCPKRQAPGVQSQRLMGSDNCDRSPTKANRCDSGPESRMSSPSPPPTPGRSVSLLVRTSYDYSPQPSPAKPEPRVPRDTVGAGLKSPPLKGSSVPVISPSPAVTEPQKKKLSVASKKPAFPPTVPPTDTVVHARHPEHTSSNSFTVMATAPPKVSPKRGIPKPPPHPALGTTHMDTELQMPKTCPSTYELQEVASSKKLSPGRKGQLSDSSMIPHRPSFSGANESLTSQVNSPSPSSSSSRSQGTSQSRQNPPEKGPKTRLPIGLKVLMKSPQLLRKTSMVPGKQEKDSLNEASRSYVTLSKSNPEDSRDPASLETSGDKRTAALLGPPLDSLARGLPLESALPGSVESSISRADGREGVENRWVKRSFSSSKPHLKPALGMNGAKARSQSFSIHLGEKPSMASTEGPGKIRTHIITNTAERGNSLTRQNLSTEGSPGKTPCVSTSDNFPNGGRPLEQSFSRQGSLCSTGSSSSQHGSPSKLPLRMLTRPEELPTPGVDDQQIYNQEGCPGVEVVCEQPSSDHHRHPSTPTDCPQSPQIPGRMQRPRNLETSGISKLETSGRHPDVSPTGTGVVSPEAPLSPSIEEKVMLCIQENVEKGQAQTKSASVEAKPKAGPSFTSWFGFRKSRLPALSSRRTEVSKSKVEKKDTKLKSERKKEKKKAEVQFKAESELSRGSKAGATAAAGQSSEDGLPSTQNLKASQDIYNEMKLEPRNRPSPAVCSTKDAFMTELLNRVDKKGALQTETGSKGVSCRSLLEGTSQGSCFASGSVSTRGSQKKNIKTKVDMEKPRESLGAEVHEDLREDEEDRVADSTLQSHAIESNCQMRTLDSGIGTFPLPDSGNRSMGRYTCQQDSPEDPEPLPSLHPTPSVASSARAQTLEHKVPCSIDSQSSSESTIIHSISDPSMMARGMQSHLPKPTSSGKTSFQKQNEAESKTQPASSFDYAEEAVAREPLSGWGEDAATETQELKQVEETKEDPENRLSEISLESFNKFNSNTVILLEPEKSPSKVKGQKEEKGKKIDVSSSNSARPGMDNVESLSDSLYDSFSSCTSQASHDA